MATITANISASDGLIPLSAEVPIGFYTIDSENIYVTGMSRGADGRDFTRLTASVDRAVGGSTAATHTSGATLTRYYPDAAAAEGGLSNPVTETLQISTVADVNQLVVIGPDDGIEWLATFQATRGGNQLSVVNISADFGVSIGQTGDNVEALAVYGRSPAPANSVLLVIYDGDSNELLKVHSDGGVLMPNLPTADPTRAGELWQDNAAGRVIKVSAG